MSSVAQKFKYLKSKLNAERNAEDFKKIENMTLAQLSGSKISFGKSQLGKTFPEAFANETWTQSFLTRYEHSTKPEHRAYIKYVELMVEQQMMNIKTKKVDGSSAGYGVSSMNASTNHVDEEDSASEGWEPLEVQQIEKDIREIKKKMETIEKTLFEILQKLQP